MRLINLLIFATCTATLSNPALADRLSDQLLQLQDNQNYPPSLAYTSLKDLSSTNKLKNQLESSRQLIGRETLQIRPSPTKLPLWGRAGNVDVPQLQLDWQRRLSQFEALQAPTSTLAFSLLKNLVQTSRAAEQLDRDELADQIAARRALHDIAMQRLWASAPSLRETSLKLLRTPNINTWIEKSPELKMAVAIYRRAGDDEMRAPFGTGAVSNGAGYPGDIIKLYPKMGSVGKNAAAADDNAQFSMDMYNMLPSANEVPDPGHLPYSISFVVEINMGTGAKKTYCSGALLAADLVLTARHCVIGKAGGVYDGGAISVRSVNGPKVIQGRPGTPWILHVPVEGYESYGDVALIRLAEKFSNNIPFAQVALAHKEHLLVLMAGVGITDSETLTKGSQHAVNISKPQIAEFNNESAMNFAKIAWSLEKKQVLSTQCNGDSGGPVFVNGKNNRPLIVGVISGADGAAWSPSDCARTYRGNFVNLGHPAISGPLCTQLFALGFACSATFDYVPKTLATKQ